MSLYGLNRPALNGGVSGIIAGAAMVVAMSSMAGVGTRNVLPSSAAISTSTLSVNGRRLVPGGGGAVGASSLTALPALLHLQSAYIVASSGLQAVYTDAWALATCQLQGSGFIARPGDGKSFAVSAGSADGLVTLGFASNLIALSSLTADASVKLSGQSTWQRDGYASGAAGSILSANGLKTALGYAQSQALSTCTSASIKTHGGSARFDSVFSVSVVASTDAAWSLATSDLSATAVVTQFGAAQMDGLSWMSVDQTVTTFGYADVSAGLAEMTASGRLALQAQAVILSQSNTTSDGTRVLLGLADAPWQSTLAAQWSVIKYSSATLAGLSTLTAAPMTNAMAMDPDERTMRRTFVDRTLRRPFVDRTMKRPV